MLLFTRYESWEEKYRLLIEIGKQLPVYPEEFRNEDHRVKGCQSQVWLHADLKDGMVNLRVDSDALIVKGLAALLVKLYSQATPEQILATSPEFISILDLGSHLSPSRANGLFAMVKQIKYYAAAFQVLQNQAR
ncbi:MAG: SufE family protein [Bdellovibrionales bacterium]